MSLVTYIESGNLLTPPPAAAAIVTFLPTRKFIYHAIDSIFNDSLRYVIFPLVL